MAVAGWHGAIQSGRERGRAWARGARRRIRLEEARSSPPNCQPGATLVPHTHGRVPAGGLPQAGSRRAPGKGTVEGGGATAESWERSRMCQEEEDGKMKTERLKLEAGRGGAWRLRR
ncbi:unnamed protein product [Merluccius merluccius]